MTKKCADFGEPKKNIAIKKIGKERSGNKRPYPAGIFFLVLDASASRKKNASDDDKHERSFEN